MRHVGFAALLLLFVLASVIVWKAVTARPGDLVDYHRDLYDLARQTQGLGDNEWEVFVQTIAEAQQRLDAASAAQPDVTADVLIYGVSNPGDDDPERAARLRARGIVLLESLKADGLFEQTARLTDVEAAIRPPGQGPLALLDWSYTRQARRLVRVQLARMTLAAERRDWRKYAAAFDELLTVAWITASQATLVEYLVALAFESAALHTLREDLAAGAIDDLVALNHIIAAIDRRRLLPATVVLEANRFAQLDTLQRIHTSRGRIIRAKLAEFEAMAGKPPPSLARYKCINVVGIAFPSHDETVEDLNDLFERSIAMVAGPAFARTEEFDVDDFYDALPRLHALRMLRPAVAGFPITVDQSRTIAAATMLLAQIEQHRLESGQAPESLADLAAAGVDIIDPMTGEPFLYRHLTDDPWGRPYLLYAAGYDRRDDGAVEHPQLRERALQPQGGGWDYIINPPPQRGGGE